jgi:hypothetical protein
MASKKQAINKAWLRKFADGKLPQVLKSLREKNPPSVADFVRLVELEWQRNPVKPTPRQVIWVDNIDDAPDFAPPRVLN